MISLSRRRRAQRGQALVETAIVFVVLVTMLSGVYAVSQYAADQSTAGTATRSGARLAAELGNAAYQATTSIPGGCQLAANGGTGLATDPCAIDLLVVQVTCQVAAAMPFVLSLDEIDIYQPSVTDGSRGRYTERYIGCGANTRASGGPAYLLSLRNVIHPSESYIGVSLKYHYKSPTPFITVVTTATVYTVLQESPRYA